MSAERLREAARVLRERAEAATPGPWAADVRPNGRAWLDFAGVDGHDIGAHGYPDDATYIATMHPGVGLALADWLDQIVETHESDPSDYCGGQGHDGFPCNAWWCANVTRALAVADAILGGAS